jgi:hypothetical protein
MDATLLLATRKFLTLIISKVSLDLILLFFEPLRNSRKTERGAKQFLDYKGLAPAGSCGIGEAAASSVVARLQ